MPSTWPLMLVGVMAMGRVGSAGWVARLDAWLAPFLAAAPRAEPRRRAPFHVRGLLLAGERKSVEPQWPRGLPEAGPALDHSVSAPTEPHERLERVLADQADRLVGGNHAVPVVDDTALVK